MRDKIRFYKEHPTQDGKKVTCGPACMLMLLDYYGKLDHSKYPTIGQEMHIYNRCRTNVRYQGERFHGVTGASIASYLAQKGLAVRLVHSSEHMMDNRDGYFPPDLFSDLYEEYHEKIKIYADQFDLAVGAEINCDTLRQELDAGRQLILETIVPGDADGIHDHVLHWILVYGYEGEFFQVCDPLSSKITLTSAEMEGYMDTPIGKIYIAVSRKEPV